MTELSAKVVVVTGSSRGIGKALVSVFTQAGATVMGASRTEGTNLTQESDVTRFFDSVMAKHGRLDILVNNAGVLTPRKNLVEVTKEEWDISLAGNLTSVFLSTREALRRMGGQDEGLIINLSSGVADRPAPTWGPYATAKWGTEGLAKLVAEEEKDSGIRVVSINPGRTRTPMRAAAYPDEDPQTVKPPEDVARFVVAVADGTIPFTSGELLQYRDDF